MKKVISLLVSFCLLLSACSNVANNNVENETKLTNETINETQENNIKEKIEKPQFYGLDDPKLQKSIKDNVYAEIAKNFEGKDYVVENIDTIYLSKEYIDELTYNSQPNIFFGYTLKEVEDKFNGGKYVFTVNDDGNTIVKEVDKYDDTYEKIIKNVAVGSGVILVCVTVSVVTGGVGAPAVSAILATSAKTGTVMALSSGTIGGLTTGIITGIKTKDFKTALKSAELSASEGFKWGAISGVALGGAKEFLDLKNTAQATKELALEANAIAGENQFVGLTMNQVAQIQKESKLPLEIISQIKSFDEYLVYRDAGLYPQMVSGKIALLQDIDWNLKSEVGGKTMTNLERVKAGYSPICIENGEELTYQLHHINQEVDATLAVLKEGTQHQGNAAILDVLNKKGVHSIISDYEWHKVVTEFWTDYVKILGL